MLKIAIVDIIGLTYDGNTLSNRGLGGSESAVILLSKELSRIGFEVTVYNNCIDKDSSEGVFDGVEFIDINNIKEREFDILISSRTIIPFVPENLFHIFQPDQYGRHHDCKSFKLLKSNYKVLWKHDTFCMGDEYLEELLVENHFDEIFTLSDFHTNYISTSDHGKKRIYEVIKDRIFQTRNGIVNYFPEVDISKKDKNHFVFNASITKGMIPLVKHIWPKIKQNLPDAKLTIIGGYYRFRENANPDEQELMWRELIKETKNLDITFTGIITQQEIAEIYKDAYLFLYPGAFPETHGISTLESLNYNTPLLATRFGALGETATENSYFIDYAIEPTPLSPWIGTNEQIDKFVNNVISIYNNPYLHQQKMYACNNLKNISTWDTIALQWKQHFYKRFNRYLTKDEFITVTKINNKVKEVFNRKTSNSCERYFPKSIEKPLSIIVPVYNSEKYINNTILSISSQNYENYKCTIINDNSTDNTFEVIVDTLNTLPLNIQSKFHLIDNKVRVGAVRNQYDHIMHQPEDSIIVLIDGDDFLYPDNSIFDYISDLHTNYDFTYGSMFSLADKIPLIAQPYPKNILENRNYRSHKFNWGIPYTHLRTFKRSLMEDISEDMFKDDNGDWYMAGGDNAMFYNLIEQCDPSRIKAVSKVTYLYNDLNPINDYKVNQEEQDKNSKEIQNKGQNLKKILIAIPTAKYIEPQTFKSIYDLELPEGYVVDFQYFYGYRIDQIRNLISDWVIGGYDYLFSVDSDISFAPDTLKKLLSHDKDIISGIYRQRKPEQTLELYRVKDGFYYNVDINEVNLLDTVSACGFGCVLIKKKVFTDIGYPQFEYHSAIDHKNTISEDVDFCMKASEKGYLIWVDGTVICDHYGETIYRVQR